MNKILPAVITFLLSLSLSAQIQVDTCTQQSVYFNDPESQFAIIIDSINNPDNIWQVGVPDKNNIPLPFTSTISMVTDTMLPYPTDDTSSFIMSVCHFYGQFYPGTTLTDFYVDYYMDSDSLNDFGKIEISLDHGITWWDVDALSAFFNVSNYETILTGNSGGKKTMYFNPMYGGGTPDFFNHFDSLEQSGIVDMMLVKFSFISDGNPENKMGWVIESIDMSQSLFSSVDDLSSDFFQTKVTPNPAAVTIHLQILNERSNNFQLNIFSSTGQLVHHEELLHQHQTSIDVAHLPNGIYHYSIFDLEKNQQSAGKFIIQH